MVWTNRLCEMQIVERCPFTVKFADRKALIGLILITAVALMACGGSLGGGETNAGPQIAAHSADAVPVVSPSMDDYLCSTVVLYFSFPG